MANSVYTINKGINKAIEFRGLKAQYIGYLGICLIVLLILFALLYILGVAPFLCMGVVFTAGTLAVIRMYRLSHQYGEHGLMKKLAHRHTPHTLKCSSRRTFKKTNHGKAA